MILVMTLLKNYNNYFMLNIFLLINPLCLVVSKLCCCFYDILILQKMGQGLNAELKVQNWPFLGAPNYFEFEIL